MADLKITTKWDNSEMRKGAQEAEQISKDATESIAADFGNSMQEISKNMQASISVQKSVIKDLENELKGLQKIYQAAAPGLQQVEIGKQVGAKKAELEAEKLALQQLTQAYEQHKLSQASIRTEYRNIIAEMAKLRTVGQQESARYKELERDLQRVGIAMRTVTKEAAALSSGGSFWQGLSQGINVLSGLATASTGIFSVFSNDQEKLIKIQKNLQSVMAVSMGMMQVSNALHQTSAFRISFLTKVTNLFSAAQVKLAATSTAAKIATGGLVTLLATGLGIAISWIYKYIKSQNDQTEAAKKAAEAQKEINDKWNQSVANNLANQLYTLRQLQKEWEKLGGNLDKQKQFIIDNEKEFNKLGVAVNSVKDAEAILVQNTPEFVQALKQRARASAAAELAVDQYKEAIKAEEEARQRRANLTKEDIKAGKDYVISELNTLDVIKRGTLARDKASVARKGAMLNADKEAKVLDEVANKANKAGDAYFDLKKKADNAADYALSGLGLKKIDTKIDASKSISALVGSIKYIDEKLSNLKVKFEAAIDEKSREKIGKQIKDLEQERKIILDILIPDGSISKIDAQISGLQEDLKLAISDNDIAKIQRQIKDLEEKRDIKLNAYLPENSIAAIENQISRIEGKIKITEDAEELKRLNERLNSEQERLQIAVILSLPEGSKERLQKELDLIDFQKNLLPQDAQKQFEQLEEKARNIRIELEKFPKEIFPAGSLGDYDQKIAKLNEELPKLVGVQLEVNRAAIAYLEVRRALSAGDFISEIDKEKENLEALTAAYETATEAQQKLLDVQIQASKDRIAKLEEEKAFIIDWGTVISTSISGLAEAFGQSFAGADFGDSIKKSLLLPLANLAKQMGAAMVSFGIAALKLKTLLANPVTAIAAGVALGALGSALAASIQGSINAVTGGSTGAPNSNTFTGGYSNAGALSNDMFVKNQQVQITGQFKLEGRDLIASIDKTEQYKGR